MPCQQAASGDLQTLSTLLSLPSFVSGTWPTYNSFMASGSNLSFSAFVRSSYVSRVVVGSRPYAVCAPPTSLTLSHRSIAASSHLLIAATPSKCWSQSVNEPFPGKGSGVRRGRPVPVPVPVLLEPGSPPEVELPESSSAITWDFGGPRPVQIRFWYSTVTATLLTAGAFLNPADYASVMILQ